MKKRIYDDRSIGGGGGDGGDGGDPLTTPASQPPLDSLIRPRG